MLVEVVSDLVSNIYAFSNVLVALAVILAFSVAYVVLGGQDLKFPDVPGPRGYPYWGNTFTLGAPGSDMLARLLAWSREYGETFKLYVKPGGYFIYTSNLEHVRHILTKNASNYTKSTTLANLFHMTAGSIVFAEGKDYYTQRKMIKPVFTMHGVKVFIDIYNQKTEEMIQVIEQRMADASSRTHSADIKLLEDISKLCLDIIGECAIGYKFDSLHGQESPEISALLNFTSLEFNIARFAVEDTLPFAKFFWSGERNRLLESRNVVRKMITKAISQRKLEMDDDDEVFERGDLLDALLKLYKHEQLDANNFYVELCSQIFTFLIAGFEPVGLTIFWTLYLLAKYPEIQERVREEVRKVNDNNNRRFYLETFGHMDLLGRCIKESQRLYPSVILLRRTAKKDDILGDLKIPAGTDVAIGICSIHRDPSNWESPSEFNPDRFLSTDDKDPSTGYKFLPYGRGGRMCLATWFAEIEMKAVLAKLISSFRYSLASADLDDIPCHVKVTLKPKFSPVFRVEKCF